MTPIETAALVALLRLGRRPPSHYSELVECDASALTVLERELAQNDDGQTRLPLGLSTDELIERAAGDVAGWEAAGMRPLTVLEPDYPDNLRAVHDRPPLLFVAGQLEQRRDQRSVAVIGSRRATAEGVERANGVAGHLADRGYTIVSGLAAGIDTAAHTTALAMRARTVAVIGTGLSHAYPTQNAELQSEIAANGAVLSQFWPDEGPSRTNFPMRNAVMSGLALATVIVEASQTSGARVQARLAQSHGRPVFLARALLASNLGAGLGAGGRASTCSVPRPRSRRCSTASHRPARWWPSATSMPQVAELTDLYANFMLGPRPGPGVCDLCLDLTDGRRRCPRCERAPEWLDAVAPVSYSVAHEQLHHALAGYKRPPAVVARRFEIELAAVLWRFLALHETCIAHAARDRRAFDLVTTVPSSTLQRDATIRCIESWASSRDRREGGTSACSAARRRRSSPAPTAR